ncbi:exocyst complex component 6B-like [Carlito syrichta]|uniref:Exocyst complex component 6B-like n=1 Tax=Carlito syrichta TaxID=1868482 RepID=A0A3Q0DRZ0_CARSF|nr:exocyst complex component 6B-like [Carlito syrichta]
MDGNGDLAKQGEAHATCFPSYTVKTDMEKDMARVQYLALDVTGALSLSTFVLHRGTATNLSPSAILQLLDLFIQWDWSTYLADYGQPNCKYLRVNPVTALTLLEKMKDTSRKNNMFAQFRKNERDKQKLIDTVAKQLRGLISSHHS